MNIQYASEVILVSVWLVGYMNVSHEMDNYLTVSPEMSYDVLKHAIVMLHNYMLMIL